MFVLDELADDGTFKEKKNRQISKKPVYESFHVIFPNQLFVYKINLLVALAMTPGAKLERT